MKQNWHDLLFAHWEIPVEQLKPLIPVELDLDLFQGRAYVAVAPFHMTGIHARMFPALPGLSRFPELNVRTYVRCQHMPGVFFFSLDAANLPAVWSARVSYGLPYFYAEMSAKITGEDVEYRSRRRSSFSKRNSLPAEFRGSYRPITEPKRREKDSLEGFLTERYCLYAIRRGKLVRAHIHHLPWPLQDAEAEIEINTMVKAAGIELPRTKPLLHFSRFLEVLVWTPERIGTSVHRVIGTSDDRVIE
jgi:hypothetical protein